MTNTKISYIENFFSIEELKKINNFINESKNTEDDPALGRLKINIQNFFCNDLMKSCEYKASNLVKKDMVLSHILYVEYNNIFGQPNLPPHFDADANSLVFDYQLESNTSWDLGVGAKLYPLKDNSALVFNANENIHWRPHKEFKDGEYVKMIFFRFYNKHNRIDYSHLNYKQNDPIFQDIINYREALKSEAEK